MPEPKKISITLTRLEWTALLSNRVTQVTPIIKKIKQLIEYHDKKISLMTKYKLKMKKGGN